MKKTPLIFLICIFSAHICLSQNVPLTSGTIIPGSITNIITPSAPFVLGTDGYVNYVETIEPQYPVTSSSALNETSGPSGFKMVKIYYDGFSRQMESFVRNVTTGHDLVVPFDNRPGINHFAYSPYSVAPSDPYCNIHLDPFTEQNSFYAGLYPDEAGTAITETSYQSTPSTRSVSVLQPGKSNVGQYSGIMQVPGTNATNEVIIWDIDPATSWPKDIGFYAPGTLMKKTITNADGAVVIEFYDIDGKLICKSILAGTYPCSGGTGTTGGGSSDADLTSPPPGDVTTTDITGSSSTTTVSGSTTTATTGVCSTYVQTYYVYDVYDRLAYTLHPSAVANLAHLGWVPNADIINNLCDFVVYDEYGRIVEAHQAGENGNDQMVYDQRNRIILSRQPQTVGWIYNLYDNLDRLVESGTYQEPTFTNRADMEGYIEHGIVPSTFPADFATPASVLSTLSGTSYLWSPSLYPSTPMDYCSPLQINYYDNYNAIRYFDGVSSFIPLSFTYDPSIFTGHTVTGLTATFPPATPSLKTRGMLTYSVSRVLQPAIPYAIPSYPAFISKAYYYDDYERNVETITTNIHNDRNFFGTQFDFTGNPLIKIANYANHDCLANPTTSLVTKYDYDPYTSSLVDIYQSINGSAGMREIADYKYNNIGQVSIKNIGGPMVEQQAYTYNIRNQLTGINPAFAEANLDGTTSTNFGESIKYDAGFTKGLVCGDITGIIWRSRGQYPQAYGYTYDQAGRLVQADYRVYVAASILAHATPTWNNTYTDYSEGGIGYDWNGNILTLNRYGPVDHGSYVSPGKIDDLSYTYETSGVSNHIQSVSDAVSLSTTTLTQYDFKDLGTTTTDYTYDDNGNAITDQNKHTTTSYNILNKPDTRIFGAPYADRNDFIYTAGGDKLADLYNGMSGTSITEYDGELIYKDNKLFMINNPEGYSVPNTTSGGFDFYYYVRDHLGNVRDVLQSYSVSGGVTPITPGEGGGYSPDGPVVYHATHETGSAPIEDLIFDNMDYVRDYKPDAMDSADVKGAHLDAADSTTTIGTTLVLKVMAGDSFSVSAQSYYSGSDTSTGIIDSAQFIDAILATLVNGTGATGNADANELANVTKLFSPNNIGVFNALGLSTADSTIPLAFINYILYDENFNIIPEDCGQIQIAGTPDSWQPITSPGPIPVHHSGYLAVFMSTATAGIPVYIDPFVVTYWKSHIVDINHYYPFGLCFNSSSSATPYPVDNTYLYQTKKQGQHNNLYLDDFDARQYDPQLGRFQSLDAYNQFPSGYTGMANNPVSTIDPSGNEANPDPEPPPDPAPDGKVKKVKPGTGISGTSWGEVPNSFNPNGSNVYEEGTNKIVGWTNGTAVKFFSDGTQGVSSGVSSEKTVTYSASGISESPNSWSNSFNRGMTWLNTNIINPFNETLNPLYYGYNAVTGTDASTGLKLSTNERIASLGFVFMPEGSSEGSILARTLGRAGEEAVGIQGAKQGIKVEGRLRYPDRVTPGVSIEEVKNVKYQAYTSQLRDYTKFATENNMRFILYTRPGTRLSAPLQQAINDRLIIHQFIPH